jgi:hypothetical protein
VTYTSIDEQSVAISAAVLLGYIAERQEPSAAVTDATSQVVLPSEMVPPTVQELVVQLSGTALICHAESNTKTENNLMTNTIFNK